MSTNENTKDTQKTTAYSREINGNHNSRKLQNLVVQKAIDKSEVPCASETFEIAEVANITNQKDKEQMEKFRDLVEIYKTKRDGYVQSGRCTDELMINTSGQNGGLYGKSTAMGAPNQIEFRDPAESSNLYEVFAEPKDGELEASTGLICLDMDNKEGREEIGEGVNSVLAAQILDSIDKSILDEVISKTAKLEHDLKILGEIKTDKYTGIEESMSKAQHAINMEKYSQIIKILKEMDAWVPRDFYDLSPEDQKNFRDAACKIKNALNLYQTSFNHANIESNDPVSKDGILGTARRAVIDATIIWPGFKEDPRVMHLVDMILAMD